MLGCSRWAIVSTSRWKRCTKSGWRVRAGSSTLTATRRRRLRCSVSYTEPIPPRPRRPSSWYLPNPTVRPTMLSKSSSPLAAFAWHGRRQTWPLYVGHLALFLTLRGGPAVENAGTIACVLVFEARHAISRHHHAQPGE